jgi:hypothetical protein
VSDPQTTPEGLPFSESDDKTSDAPQGPIAYAYHADKNPDGAAIMGVPLRSLTIAEFAGLASWQQRSVAACVFYVPTAAFKKALAAEKESA